VKGYPQIRRALAGKLWFMHEQKMNEILAFLELKLSGGSSSAETIEAIRAANEVSAARAASAAKSSSGSVAVIPVYGVIMQRPSMDLSGPGGTSCENLTQQLRQAANDPICKAIVMDFDTPGGDVSGVDELATEIYNARKQKKITAVSNCLCASAGYYLASQCTEVVVSPSSLTGSIGVYTMHEDDSKYLEGLGVKLTLIKFGENKAEGNNFEPLTDSAREHLQEMVDSFGAMFEKAVARGRKISQADVHGKFGQGRVFDAKQAVKIGMADRIGTLDDVLSSYGVSRGGPQVSAEEEPALIAEGAVSDVSAEERRARVARERRKLEIAAV
jgi:capsid assembly protease